MARAIVSLLELCMLGIQSCYENANFYQLVIWFTNCRIMLHSSMPGGPMVCQLYNHVVPIQTAVGWSNGVLAVEPS
jgi:hypothetical protein